MSYSNQYDINMVNMGSIRQHKSFHQSI